MKKQRILSIFIFLIFVTDIYLVVSILYDRARHKYCKRKEVSGIEDSIHRYHKDKGHFPDKLSLLAWPVGDYIEESMIIDPFGQAYVMKTQDDTYQIFISVIPSAEENLIKIAEFPYRPGWYERTTNHIIYNLQSNGVNVCLKK